MRFRKTLKLPTQASAGTIVMRIIANIYIQQTRFFNAARKVLGFKSKLGPVVLGVLYLWAPQQRLL